MELGHQNQWMLPFRLIEKNRALTGESISDCNPAPPRSNPKFNIFTFFNLNTEIKVTYLLFDFEKNENKTNSGVEIGKFFSFKRTLFYVSGQLERFGFDATWRIVRKGRRRRRRRRLTNLHLSLPKRSVIKIPFLRLRRQILSVQFSPPRSPLHSSSREIKSYPKSNKSPNLVTLSDSYNHPRPSFILFYFEQQIIHLVSDLRIQTQTSQSWLSFHNDYLNHGALYQEEMSNWIGPTVKQLLNYAMHVLYNFLGLSQTQQLFAWADPAFFSFY